MSEEENCSANPEEERRWEAIKKNPFLVHLWNMQVAHRLRLGEYNEDTNRFEFFEEYKYRSHE